MFCLAKIILEMILEHKIKKRQGLCSESKIELV